MTAVRAIQPHLAITMADDAVLSTVRVTELVIMVRPLTN